MITIPALLRSKFNHAREKGFYMGTLADRCRTRREQLGLDQSELARRAGCTRQHIYGIEAGSSGLSITRALALSEALIVDVRWLVRGDARFTPKGLEQ